MTGFGVEPNRPVDAIECEVKSRVASKSLKSPLGSLAIAS